MAAEGEQIRVGYVASILYPDLDPPHVVLNGVTAHLAMSIIWLL
ncbi:hypothetical protein [Arthrobacter agilis]|nr:hypothetical protein [Arthrobacter agilis]